MLIRLCAATLLLLTACTPFVPPAQELPEPPEQYQQHNPPTANQLPDRWWEVFGDSKLNLLQQKMLSGNLDLRQTLHRLEQLEALHQTSSAALWPSLSANAAASRERAPTATGSSTSDNLRVSLAASYEIDLWNRLHDRAQAAELRLQAGKQEAQTLLLSLSAQLTESYFQALEKRGQIRLVEEQIALNQKLLATATDRYRAGLASAEEIYQAEGNLLAQQERLAQLRTALQQSEQALVLLLGHYASEEITAGGSLPQLTSAVTAGLPASLLSNRPDIAAALTQLQATDHELAAALAERLPGINLTASLGHSVTRLASGDIEGTLWSLAASLAQPLLDGGRRQAEVDRQQALRNEQWAFTRKALLKAVQEVEIALTADRNNALRSERLEQQRSVSSRSLALSRANYRSGLTSSSALLSAELQHLSLLSQQLTTQREWLSSRVSLARALGGQWMSEALRKQQAALKAAEDK